MALTRNEQVGVHVRVSSDERGKENDINSL